MGDTKQRHGCLTAWLFLLILFGLFAVLVNVNQGGAIREQDPDGKIWPLQILSLLGALNVVCVLALLGWKKWGFWGICLSAAFSLVINLSRGSPIIQSMSGLVGTLLLFVFLRIGKKQKAWSQLD